MAIVWVDRMAVDVRGEGDAIVFVHGLGGSLNAWTPLLPALSRYRCLRPELPGAARSSRAYALGQGSLSAESHAAALLKVCDSLGVGSAHWVGHSFGTIVALHVAAQAPQRVRSLALFGAMAEPVPAQREAMRQRADAARREGMFEIAEGISDFALSASSKQTQPVTVAYVRDSIAAQDAEGFARNCIALAEARAAALERVRCPCLLVTGDEDAVTPPSRARELQGRLSGARLELLPRCGHWPMLERSADCQRLLREFVERVR